MIKYFGKFSPIHTLINDCDEKDPLFYFETTGKLKDLLEKKEWDKKEIEYIASFDKKLDLPLFVFLNGDIKEEELPKRYDSMNNVWINYVDLKENNICDRLCLVNNIIKYCDKSVYELILPIHLVTINLACKQGNKEVIEWLLSKNCYYDSRTFNCAVEHLDILKWLKEHGFEWDTDTFCSAIKYCNLETLKWLREQNCPWGKDLFNCAFKHFNLETLKWLREQGCPLDKWTFNDAVRYSNLETLKWLREQGCNYNKWSFESAIHRGNLDILKWLKEEGCSLDELIFLKAVECGNLEVLEWLIEENCPTYYWVINYTEDENVKNWLKEHL